MPKIHDKTGNSEAAKRNFFSSLGLSREYSYFIENLGLMLSSGMNILTALSAIKSELRSRRLKTSIEALIDKIDAGLPFSQALQKTGLAGKHVIALVKIGEESGRLIQNLKVIAEEEEKNRQFRARFRSAMIYPAIVIILSLVIGAAIAWFILPRLSRVFMSLGLDLPIFTRWLIGAGNFLAVYGMSVIPIFFTVIIILIYLIFFYSKTKIVGETFILKAPGVGKLAREVELARFGYLLGTLLQAGLPLLDSLGSLVETARFRVYRNLYQLLHDEIEIGNSFQKSFKKSALTKRLIPSPVVAMVVSGEQSGKLTEALLRIGASYEAKSEITTKNLAVVLEPILLVIVWLGVVFVALAVIMPIYSLIGGLNR